MTKNLSQFIGKYPVQKTLRFSLIPQGRTQEWIDKEGFLEIDEQRASDYQEVKGIIDDYHRWLIDDVLGQKGIKLNWKPLANLIRKYQNASDSTVKEAARKKLEEEQNKMRKEIVALFKARPEFKILNKKELIQAYLPEFLLEQEEGEKKRELVARFNRFTTYFTGFYENRQNMYSEEAQSTAISFRIVNDNFNRFLANVGSFSLLSKRYPDAIKQANNELARLLGDENLEDIFSVDAYSRFLNQEGIDYYNQLLGGISGKAGVEKIKGLNELSNLAYQAEKTSNNGKRIHFLPLYKQILSDRETLSFTYDNYENDKVLSEAIIEFEKYLEKAPINGGTENVIETIAINSAQMKDVDFSGVYIAKDQLSQFSKYIFDDWSVIREAITQSADSKLGPCEGMTKSAADKWAKSKLFSLAEIEHALKAQDYELNLEELYQRIEEQRALIAETKNDANAVLAKFCKANRELIANDKAIEAIKNYLDSLLDYLRMVQVFDINSEESRDASFYSLYDQRLEVLRGIWPIYNKVRNYVTQKPYSVEKYKLNFEKDTLCDGWDENKITANLATILCKDERYYLGIVNRKNSKAIVQAPKANTNEVYERMRYKLLPGPNKMLPKVFFSAKRIEEFAPSEEIKAIYKKGTFKKGESFSISDCHKLIDFYKDAINKHEDWSQFGFSFSDTDSYEDINGFFQEVQQQGYALSFIEIDKDYIDKLVDEGWLFLFEIYNKDFSNYSHGKKNLHTLYFEELFSERNRQDVVFKLDGGAELFYRKPSLKKKVTHKAGEILVNKTLKDGKKTRIPGGTYEELKKHFNGKLAEEKLSEEAKTLLHSGNVVTKKADHDIIKDARFTKPHYEFHTPITINFQAAGRGNINQDALEYISDNKDITILGIDRGERHLLYLSLIDHEGSILDQRSLNIIDGVDYHLKLTEREQERDTARKSWKTIGNITDLKQGYLSLAVREVANMMIENNAILAMEDLNKGFKRGRFKFEKQVYQQFEKMLIEKLNYCAKKPGAGEEPDNRPGSIRKGYQLTSKFSGFKNLGKQSGFIFYVPAWNTSHIDPTTGFVNLFSLKYKNESEAKDFFSKMKAIRYNQQEGFFEFSFDYRDFKTKQSDYTNEWTICSIGKERLYQQKENGQYKTVSIDVTAELKRLLIDYGIDFEGGEDIVMQIQSIPEGKGFFKRLFFLFSRLVELRNSTPANEKNARDFILSPVRNSEGRFFYSEDAHANEPIDADANGAYNIALKGLQMLKEQVAFDLDRECYQIEYPKKGKQNLSWLKFIQTKSYAE